MVKKCPQQLQLVINCLDSCSKVKIGYLFCTASVICFLHFFFQMKADFCIVFVVIIWIVSMSTQINASYRYCDPRAPVESCKIYETGRRRIQFRVCGSVLKSYFDYACGFRKRRKRNGKKCPVSPCKFYALANLRPFQLIFVQIKSVL